MKKSILLLSNSYAYGSNYLVHYTEPLSAFLKNIPSLLFVPYAADEKDWDAYTQIARDFFNSLGIAVFGIHEIPKDRIFTDFKAIFIGGGNTLRLFDELQSRNLLSEISSSVLSGKVKYIGVSAGTNIAGRRICLTNDVPVDRYGANIEGLNLLPFQINPHEGDYVSLVIKDIQLIGLRAGAYIWLSSNDNQEYELFLGGSNAKLVYNGDECIDMPHSTKFVLTSDGRLREINLD